MRGARTAAYPASGVPEAEPPERTKKSAMALTEANTSGHRDTEALFDGHGQLQRVQRIEPKASAEQRRRFVDVGLGLAA